MKNEYEMAYEQMLQDAFDNEFTLLALDISTTKVGVALTKTNGKPLLLGSVDLRKIGQDETCQTARLLAKAHYFMQELDTMLEIRPIRRAPDHRLAPFRIFIEEPLGNGPSISTVVMLASFNAIICSKLADKYWVVPELVRVSDVRKTLGISAKTQNKKKAVADILQAIHPSFAFPAKDFDATDALALIAHTLNKAA